MPVQGKKYSACCRGLACLCTPPLLLDESSGCVLYAADHDWLVAPLCVFTGPNADHSNTHSCGRVVEACPQRNEEVVSRAQCLFAILPAILPACLPACDALFRRLYFNYFSISLAVEWSLRRLFCTAPNRISRHATTTSPAASPDVLTFHLPVCIMGMGADVQVSLC